MGITEQEYADILARQSDGKQARARVKLQQMSEEKLGENIRDACKQLGWQFYWLRKTYNSSAGILDLLLVPIVPEPVRSVEGVRLKTFRSNRHVLHRELKGHDGRGRLGTLTPEQKEAIELINAAGGDAAMWEPADWHSGRILNELK